MAEDSVGLTIDGGGLSLMIQGSYPTQDGKLNNATRSGKAELSFMAWGIFTKLSRGSFASNGNRRFIFII